MEPVMLISLLRLPSLVYENVIEMMTSDERFRFSQISDRAKRIVRNVNNHRHAKFHFRIYFYEFFHISTYDRILLQKERIALDETRVEGYKQHLSNFRDFFKHSKFSIVLAMVSPEFIMNMLDFFKSSGFKISLCHICTNVVSDVLALKYLDFCHNFLTYPAMALKVSKDFRFENTGNIQYSFNQLAIRCEDENQWMTMDLVLNTFSKCKTLVMFGSRFTTPDINYFLKSWVQGNTITYFLFSCEKEFEDERTLNPKYFEGIAKAAVGRVRIDKKMLEFRLGECYFVQNMNGKGAILFRNTKKGQIEFRMFSD